MSKIAIDIMGGDNAPHEILKGSIEAINEVNSNLLLIGDEQFIKKEIEKYSINYSRIEIIHTTEIITNEDKPVNAIRNKKDSSMVKGLLLLKNREADSFISAGNTGALLAGSLLRVGRIKGIDRPALAPIYPTKKGFSLLIDAGANTECTPRNLLEFAMMGSIYLKSVLNIQNPRIGLVSNGIEEGKGNRLVKDTYQVLSNSRMNFIGNIEARDIPEGNCDVIVCDGFVGNVILKLTEGVAGSITTMLKEELTKNPIRTVATLMLKNGFKEFKKRLDYTEYGGAPLLGVKNAVIKAHGSSNSKALKNAIKYGEIFVKNKVVEKIEEEIAKIGVDISE